MNQARTYCCFLTVVLFWANFSSYGQENLIPNWSFEELRWPDSEFPCPTSSAAISLTKYWLSADGSVDYYHSCSNSDWPSYGVPLNRGGWQQAYDGEAYAALGCYTWQFPNAREYLRVELAKPLTRGGGYYFEMHVSLYDSLNYAISGIGVLFTPDDTRYWDDEDFFDAAPQVENPQNNLLNDKENWMTISGQFVAEGGEKFLTIGSFRRDVHETIVQVSNHPQSIYNWDESGYYIDGVELYEDNSISIVENETIRTTLYPNPSNGENVVLEYTVQKGQKLQWQITDMAGRTVLIQPLLGKEGRAILGLRPPAGVYVSAVVSDGVRMGIEKLVVQ